ncbi:hypothetical protein Pan241w_09770 [Gimesia alba]|uniref:Uncharacterized protein n=1 Tax=Gimesia alba TaxID=2527973 RepID=A0A517RAM2_9PLAN|nr:hypothetical protein [Gimesia alba]QDT40918.1 hypothetical protein Pan241w_09770 [Gimesia alba]
MSGPEVHIESYFSIETDLAQSFREWSEFVKGEGYCVELQSDDGGLVLINLIQTDEERPLILVKSDHEGELFQRALGLTTYLLAGHSDCVMVHRRV